MITQDKIKELLFKEFKRQWADGNLGALHIPGTSNFPINRETRYARIGGEIDLDEFVQNVHSGVVRLLKDAKHLSH